MSTPIYPSLFQPLGPALRSGVELNAASAADLASSEYGIVALGTTQATAFQLRAAKNYVGTTAASTGVKLPAPLAGATVTIFNAGASPLTVYGYAGETIDGTAGATGVALANALRAVFECFNNAGTMVWISAQLGVVSA